MANTVYMSKTGLIGGEVTKLDSIDGAGLVDGDAAFVNVSNVQYIYRLDADSAAVEASPNIIAPDTNAGDKRWILQSYYSGSGTLYTDHIAESTGAHGVAIDGLTIKDAGFALGSDADGDMYYRASSALVRLAKGAANQILRMNSGATAPKWTDETATFVNPTKMFFYQNTAPTGWTIDTAVTDCCLAVKGGSAAYNVSGGNKAGTWAMTEAQMPVHTHSATGSSSATTSVTASGTAASDGAHTHTKGCTGSKGFPVGSGGAEYIPTGWGDGENTGSGGAHSHSVSVSASATTSVTTTVTVSNSSGGATTYRPYAAVGIICTKNA